MRAARPAAPSAPPGARARARATVLAAGYALVLSACQGGGSPAPSPAPAGTPAASCEELAVQVVDAVQVYVDAFTDVDAAGLPAAAGERQAALTSRTAALRDRGGELGCDRDELAALVRTELDRLTGGTPVQDALVATFRADPLGSYDPSDAGPLRVTVKEATDLVTVLAIAGTGSVITLVEGDYALDAPLVALRPLTLRGPDDGEATITSTAGGAAFVVSADGDVRLDDLSIVHDGDSPASVVLVAAGGYALNRVRVAGGVADAGGGGGFGVVLRPGANPLTGGGTAQELTDVTVQDNDAGGIVVGGTAEPAIRGATLTGEAGCGICWVEDGGGQASRSTLTGFDVGLRVDDGAEPRIADVSVDGATTGLALTGSGAPEVRDSTFAGITTGMEVAGTGQPTLVRDQVVAAVDVGIRVAGRARPLIRDATVIGPSTVGLAVVEDAAPDVIGGTFTTAGDVGAIWAERGAGTAGGLTVRGARLGLQLGDDASPRLEDVTVEDTGAASLLANGSSLGEVVRLTCATGPNGVVVLAEGTTVRVTDSPTCELVDQR